jgi:MFS superfamily sulfate permease-like transporter
VTGGGTTTVGRIRSVAGQLSHINGWSAGIALAVLVLIAGAQRVNYRIPGALIGLVLSIIAVEALGLASHHGVAVLGAAGGGLPHVRTPAISWSQLRRLPATVLTVAFMCIAQTADTASHPVQVVILDANGMSDIDYTALQASRDLTTELGQRGTTVGIARASHLVHHNLKHGALLKQIGADHLFASVEGAVAALKRSP